MGGLDTLEVAMAEPTHPTLSSIERIVIALAVKDADDGVRAGDPSVYGLRSRLSSVYRRLSGDRGHTPLAIARLEALRQFGCATHRRGRVSDELTPKLASREFGAAGIRAIERLTL
jgi:hypothetical protein